MYYLIHIHRNNDESINPNLICTLEQLKKTSEIRHSKYANQFAGQKLKARSRILQATLKSLHIIKVVM
jgi:hypothetical protein